MSRRTGRELAESAEAFYDRNSELMSAHVRAARVFAERGFPVSARSLTEFARYIRLLGADGIQELADAYEGIDWDGGEYSIANATSPYLTRYLERLGFKVSKARSKMDEKESEPEWDGQNYVISGL